MSLKTSWPLRCALVLLTAHLVSACGKPDPDPNPNPGQDTSAPATRATPAGGSFSQLVAVALVCDDGAGSGCAATYYTLDGSTPGTGSTQYHEPFTLSATTTVRFFSVDKAGNTEAVKSEQYTLTSAVDTQAPTTTASLPGGAYNSPRSVALTCNDGAGSGCAATYYTLDGSVPTEASPRYSAPLAISANTTLRFFSVDVAGNVEGARLERYVLDTEAPTVSASPRGGNHGASVEVTLTCDDGNGSGCASIHYTTDGSIPSAASSTYGAPLRLESTTRLRFLAVDRAGNASEEHSEVYTLDRTGPVSAATPRGGAFRSAFTVALTCDDGTGSGCAATYFTTNGAPPTRASERYTGPISIGGNTTLRFFSVDVAGNDGPMVTETYVVDQAAPVTRATPPGRSYGGEQFVTLACEDLAGSGCAATYYTLDGTPPTTASPLYVMPVRVSSSLTLRFFSVDRAGNVETAKTEPYLIDTVPPTASAEPRGGNYSSVQQVSLSCSDGAAGSGCAAIHFTLDGSQPTIGSPVYTSPLRLSSNTTLRFFAVDDAGNRSSEQTERYSIDVSAPLTTANPAGGLFGGDTQVTLDCDDGQGGTGCAVTRYTLDGNTPTDASPRYEGPITVTSTRGLRFFSVDAVGNREPVRVVTFTIDRVAPVTTPSVTGGSFTSAQSVSLSCEDSGGGTCAATHFTTDGTPPTTSSPRYSGTLRFETTTTLRFFSVDALGNAEAAKVETYVIDSTPPTTTATPGGGTYRAARDVVLTCDDAGGVGCANPIRYSTNPAAPAGDFLSYTGPIRISANTTLRFFSTDGLGNTEAVKTETYVIDTVAPTVSAEPRGGAYFTPQTVRLTCADVGSGCSAIHYTTNGATPDTGSPRYTGELFLSTNTSLRFIAVDAAGNTSAVAVETYTFSSDTTAPVTTASPPGTFYGSAVAVTLSCSDAGGSGCAGTFYTLDGSEPSTSSTRYTGAFTVSTSTQVRFRSVDAVGNLEASRSESYTIDTTAPVTRAVPAGGIYTDPVAVMLECTDSGSLCRETRYTTDGSEPHMASPLYEGPFLLTRDTTVRFFSVDRVGNIEAVKTEVYDLQLYSNTASEQIAAVREQPDGPVNMTIDGAIITYVKPLVGNTLNDPAGFFLQAEQRGPAIFVEVNPFTLSPVPEGGERVNVTVSERFTRNGQARATISSYTALSWNNPVEEMVQDVSGVDLPSLLGTYESEYVSISGTVGSSGFVSAGTGHVQAPLVTAGVPEGSASAPNMKLRVVETVRDSLDLSAGCEVTVVSPLWRFHAAAQPSVWKASHVTSMTCPGPRVTSAQAGDRNSVVVRFDRRIDPASILANGSQFSIPGLTVTSAAASDRNVWLNTTNQTPRQSYTVTVAATVRDMQGSPLDPAAASASFTGFVQPARLRISEIAPNVPSGRDLVELYVVQGGSVQGATLVDGNNTDAPLATLPDVTVAEGDFIIVHLVPDILGGTDAPGSETTGVSQYPQGVYPSNYDTAWDFHGGASGISSVGNRTLRIQDNFGVTQDAIAVIQPFSTFAGYLTQLQALQAEGQWAPPDCNGVPCTYTSFPSAYDVSVNWADAFVTPGKDTTLRRISGTDSDTASDWFVGAASLGFASW
ncbi:chitobiase/beta-hexosaminidase C-terminal domain-containing protein [Myxococcus sp. RHSTA-1-4]|uniref:chitobiase/beta-hexosaminidase C-terminal domain-containing protein n=1 Tax=Myxococcus sp. RHSTA-1-4 TaxID=2874601 RepID=UPI001CBFADC9|nr:chitobiase/beta-hexosaminidase C-terminal domain-containing protein [Myxococcus sp. RHSTA-1-4]MBZ4417788.1 chitobiase/beta-hexosaminidase C-terminal domain-containing protein [Myxococcus sp. RHSTA-1-4]